MTTSQRVQKAQTLNLERFLLRLEKVFVVTALFLFSGGLLTLLRQMSGASGAISSDPSQTDPVSQAVFLLVYGIAAYLVVVWRKRFVRVVARDNLLWLLVGLVLISVLWSAAPEVTLRRSIALLGTTLLGVYVAMRFSLREQLQLLAWALGMGAFLSLLFPLSLPTYVPPPAYGLQSDVAARGWYGVYGSKNTLGFAMALGALVFMFLAMSERRYRWVGWAGFGLSVILLLLSNSKTALVVLLTLVLLVPLYYTVTQWHYALAVPLLIAAVLLYTSVARLVLAGQETVLDLLNRDATLTSRTEVWSAVIDMIWKRPWLGYGYEAFWLGWEGPSAYVALVVQYIPSHAHNGFLDLWLKLGLLGVVVFALGFIRASVRAVNWARLTQTRVGLWPLTYLTYMLLYSLTESTILTRNSITWVLYVTVVLSMPRNMVRPPRGLTTLGSPGFRDRGGAPRVKSLRQ